MQKLSSIEAAAVERCADAPMLDQVREWAAVNSGTRNLAGLETVAGLLADAFSALPGDVELKAPAAVEAMGPDGSLAAVEHG